MKPNIGSGDGGETSVSGGRRVPKDGALVEALGAIDEASCAVGLARSFARGQRVKDLLNDCQTALQKCAAEVAAAGAPRATDFDFDAAVTALESEIRLADRGAVRPSAFVNPGSTQGEAALHLARSMVRRAERRVFALRHNGPQPPADVARYLNRLSDLLFDLAYAEASW
jgi:cob(I)alamin adenosyltransferase